MAELAGRIFAEMAARSAWALTDDEARELARDAVRLAAIFEEEHEAALDRVGDERVVAVKREEAGNG